MMLNCLKKNIIQKNYMQYILKERIISMNKKKRKGYNYTEKYNKNEWHYGEKNIYIYK